jgi:tungstate transport system permease protein
MSDSVFSEAIQQAGHIIFSGDAALWEIILLSFRVSLSALFISLIVGIPVAILITVYRFRGDRVVKILIDTMMALPPVVIGLIVYLMLSRSGPLGIWGLLYTPTAMIIAQAVLITPIVIALSLQVFSSHWQRLKEQLYTLGYRPHHCIRILIRESKTGLITVTLAAFGRAIAEIGAVMIVGGNIEHYTRVMTTAIAMETRQGNLSLALALGMILILLALLTNSTAHMLTRNNDRLL